VTNAGEQGQPVSGANPERPAIGPEHPVLDPERPVSDAERVLAEAQRICAVPAPTFAEQERAELVAQLFAEAGAQPERDAVGNVVCRLGPPGPAAVFAAHLDTVFPLEQPIEIVRRDGRICAPGIGDNSLAVAGVVHLARVFARQAPDAPLVLAATVGEEGLGDLKGAKHLVASLDCACFVAVEGQTLDSIDTGGIGSTRYRVTYRGPGGHSWGDRGTPSAIHGLVQRSAEFLASADDPRLAVNVGRVHGGTSINTIAAQATLELDLRSLDPGALTAVSTAAFEHFRVAPPGLRATVEVVGERPSGGIDPGDPLLEAARRARTAAGLGPAEETASSTDANAAYGQGIPAITVGITTGDNVHRPDEYIDEAPVAGGLRALELLARELANG
jgi:tripeptide aminopeptidase